MKRRSCFLFFGLMLVFMTGCGGGEDVGVPENPAPPPSNHPQSGGY